MAIERAPHLPGKAKLTWHISRLLLDASGTVWFATGLKGGLVAVIPLPSMTEPPPTPDSGLENAWLAEIEAAFEANAFDPIQREYLEGLP